MHAFDVSCNMQQTLESYTANMVDAIWVLDWNLECKFEIQDNLELKILNLSTSFHAPSCIWAKCCYFWSWGSCMDCTKQLQGG
jgi:hypothetical protein